MTDGSFGKAADKVTLLFNGKISSANLVETTMCRRWRPSPGRRSGEDHGTGRAHPPAGHDRRNHLARPRRRAVLKESPGRADDLKRVLYGKDYTVRAIQGSATLTNSRLALENLAGSFRDNSFKLGAAVTFTPAQPQPYALTGLIDVSSIAVGELRRDANPKEKPMVESTVKVAAKLIGNGSTLPDLLERTYGTFDVSGGKGVLRALGQKGETVGSPPLLGLAGAIAARATRRTGRLERNSRRWSLTFSCGGADAALNMKLTAIDFFRPPNASATGTMNYVEVSFETGRSTDFARRQGFHGATAQRGACSQHEDGRAITDGRFVSGERHGLEGQQRL